MLPQSPLPRLTDAHVADARLADAHVADATAPVIPRRPEHRTNMGHRVPRHVQDQTVTVPNLFADVFSGVIDMPASPAGRARVRAHRMVVAALERAEAQALPQLANFWQAGDDRVPPSGHAVRRSAPQPDAEVLALRAVLCARPDRAPDAPATEGERDRLRLAVHALNTTLTIAYPPLGAVVMTYSVLRGESLRLTTRSLVLMGTVMTLMQNHIGLA